ncbi:efflux transporter outer membrane subunit [Pseudomonas graminis]
MVLLLTGCSWLRSPPPAAPVVPARWATDVTSQPTDRRYLQDFWVSLGDPDLPGVLDQAIRQNHELKLSGLQMKLAQLQATLTGLSRWPDASLGANASLSRPLTSTYGISPSTSHSAGAGASLSYPLDIWGVQLAQREAANIDAQASESDWQAARLALRVSVTQAYWQLGYQNRVVNNAQSDLDNATEALRLANVRYQVGATSWGDVIFAQQALAGQQSALSQSQQQLTEARFAFAMLMGGPPETRYPEPHDLADTPLPIADAGLPADLLSRRPDVHAAELRVRSSLANADATRLSFYPGLSLTGSIGTSSSTLTDLLANPMGSLAAALALPFVQFNTARITKESARINYEMAVIHFKKSLYLALQETENTLSARQYLTKQADYLRDILKQSTEAERLTLVRWQQGSTDIKPWLDAQQSRRQAELSLLQNTLARKNNAVQLYAVLGGSYQGVSVKN